jgi:carboxyl-terminal processing protease
VITPYEGTPSFRAGIHPGDIISAVDGKATDGWTSDQVAKALKGPKGTHVQVTTSSRVGQVAPLVFDLVRDEIPHPSVDLKYEIRPGVGYIHLTQFQETTGDEMTEAINGFGDLKGLVIDLRNNPGGLLSQAVDVCDHLLTKGTRQSSRSAAAPTPTRTTRPRTATAAKPFPSLCWSTAVQLQRRRLFFTISVRLISWFPTHFTKNVKWMGHGASLHYQ